MALGTACVASHFQHPDHRLYQERRPFLFCITSPHHWFATCAAETKFDSLKQTSPHQPPPIDFHATLSLKVKTPSNLAGLFWTSAAPARKEALGASGDDGSPQRQRIMNRPSHRPKLSPQFCFSFGTLRDFLRLSRSTVDDSIAQNLNALVTPAEAGFDPASTSRRTPRPRSDPIDTKACNSFKENVLFPSWKTRTEVLNYCGLVATSPDPDDPEAALRELETQKDRDRVVDERLDPYSGRFSPREARTQTLALLVRQERSVENIIRSRTWEVIQDRCGPSSRGWQEALAQWQAARASKSTNSTHAS